MIDWARVKELYEDIGPADFAQVNALFLAEVEAALARVGLTRAEEVERHHFLKGAALNLGFRQFAALCGAAEDAFASPGGRGVDAGALRDCYALSRGAFLEGLGRMGLPAPV